MNTLTISLLSGLFGAIIAAVFSYYIRLSVLSKDRKEKEKKLAYVYVVQLSKYVAIDITIDSVIEGAQQMEDYPRELVRENGDKYAFSMFIAKKLHNELDEEKLDEKGVENLLGMYREGFKRVYLTYEEQALLPRNTIVQYVEYEQRLKTVETTITTLMTEREIDADQIVELIDNSKVLCEAARKLRSSMAEFGEIKHTELEAIDKQYLIAYAKDVQRMLGNEDNIDKLKALK